MRSFEEIGRIVIGVIHDSNNILAGIYGAIDLIRMNLRAANLSHLEAVARKALSAIEGENLGDAKAQLQEVVLGLERLNFSGVSERVDRADMYCGELTEYNRWLLDLVGRRYGTVQSTTLEQIVNDGRRFLERLASESRTATVNLEINCAQRRYRSVSSFFDKTLVRRGIANLVTNARDAIEEGEGSVTITTGVVTGHPDGYADACTIGPPPTGTLAFLEVKDTGRGMNPAELENMTKDGHTTKEGSEHGYGLMAVTQMAKHHGATIVIWSASGHGTKIAVLFPVRDEPPSS